MKSFMASPATIERKWYVVDATGYTFRYVLTSEVAKVLRGKNKPDLHTAHGLRRLCNHSKRREDQSNW